METTYARDNPSYKMAIRCLAEASYLPLETADYITHRWNVNREQIEADIQRARHAPAMTDTGSSAGRGRE